MGTAGSRIADLTRWELLRSKDFALLRHFRRNGLGLGNTRQQRGGSRQQKSKGSASHSPIIAHRQTPQLFAAIIGSLSLESADVNVVVPHRARRRPSLPGRTRRPCGTGRDRSGLVRSRRGRCRPAGTSSRCRFASRIDKARSRKSSPSSARMSTASSIRDKEFKNVNCAVATWSASAAVPSQLAKEQMSAKYCSQQPCFVRRTHRSPSD
jgi:hypothetical protein